MPGRQDKVLTKGKDIPFNSLIEAFEGNMDSLKKLELDLKAGERILKVVDKAVGTIERFEGSRIGRALAGALEKKLGVEESGLPPGVRKLPPSGKGTKSHDRARSIIDQMTPAEARKFADQVEKDLKKKR